jgi:site-specific DNA-cytosine methylase
MLRVIREVKPKYVVGENVIGIVSWDKGLVFEDIHIDLEAEGYEVQAIILPALSVGAYHRRDRVWFIANSISQRCKEQQAVFKPNNKNKSSRLGNTPRLSDWSEIEPPICGGNNGLSNRMDRLKQLGNSIVPQVAFQIFKAIQQIEDYETN